MLLKSCAWTQQSKNATAVRWFPSYLKDMGLRRLRAMARFANCTVDCGLYLQRTDR